MNIIVIIIFTRLPKVSIEEKDQQPTISLSARAILCNLLFASPTFAIGPL